MVRLRLAQTTQFPESAPAANPVFFRTYSRRIKGRRESWEQVCDRTLRGLIELGKLTEEEGAILARMQHSLKSLPSGRWLWVGGSEWIDKPENFSGAYNCTSTNAVDWRAFGLMMDLAMMGCGTGAVLEPQYINQLPRIRNHLNVTLQGEIGATPASQRREETQVKSEGNNVTIYVGDSRQGWVKSYQTLLQLATDERFSGEVTVAIDLSDVRPVGETLKGFGGVANPIKLPELYKRCAAILNQTVGRQLNSVECCLLIDEAAVVVVAGNVRRSAGMRQSTNDDELFANAKSNLWQQDENGNWRIDPERDALRMANHTRVFHHKPTLEECINAVRNQYYSGEGAIQYAPEAIARANADILTSVELKREFIKHYATSKEKARFWLQNYRPEISDEELEHRLSRYALNPCVTADTWIHTGEGPRQVKELIGMQHSTYVNGELFSTTGQGFFFTGIKPVVRLQTQEGYNLRLTETHQVLKVTAQTQKHQYSEWVAVSELKEGDRVLIHNHRELSAWDGKGTEAEGWLLGNLVGDGCFSVNPANHTDRVQLSYWGDNQVKMQEYALDLVKGFIPGSSKLKSIYHPQNKYFQISSAGVAKLASQFGIVHKTKAIAIEVEQASYNFYCGFLRGLFDADGSVQETQNKGVCIRLAQSNLQLLEAVQRMLLRLGIASCIYKNRRTEGMRMMPNSKRKLAEYFSQDGLQHGKVSSPSSPLQHQLIIANDNIAVFQEIIGFQDSSKSERLQSLLSGYKRKFNRERFAVTVSAIEPDGEEAVYDCTVPGPARFDANGFVAHNCGEIIGANFHCNLAEIHLNQIDPHNYKEQEEAFTAGALSVASLLNHKFIEPRYQFSREIDPIVGVSFTGLFDFFVRAFGVEWLHWWTAGRPETPEGLQFKQQEEEYLQGWQEIVHRVVWNYCDRHNIKRPNRCTTVQPSGTKSLLTGASPGWHPPKAQRFIRRITFRKNDPVALACIDYGYNIVPSQSDKDESGNLLSDPFDPRCSEWLVEIPVAVPWANLPGADEIEIAKFSAIAQMDFYMQVQKFYARHNTSATIELRENEVEVLGNQIYQAIQNDEGYISAALLARFDDHQSFPRLPFEPIDKATYDRLTNEVRSRRKTDDFCAALSRYDAGELIEAGPSGCDSDRCLFSDSQPTSEQG